MDFDDLLGRVVDLLELFPDVRERYQRMFRWVLVDEYQDTNRVQYRLLQLLCEEHGNLMVVGDDFQSIYSFRSADIRNILDFESDFPDATVVKLEQNYRSTGTILDAANAVIANNRDQKPKRLWTEAERGEPVRVSELSDEHEEARYVASEIERLATEEGVPRDRIAVFYRVNAQSRVLEDTLVRFEVPYQVIGGTKFYERAEIKDAVAYLSLLANPADAISFARIVNSPRRGIGDRTQGRVLSHANTIGADVWEAFATPAAVPGLGAGAVRALERFAETMASLRQRAERDGSIGDLLEAVLHESGYLEALEAEARGDVTVETRIENLEELVGVAREFDQNREVEGPSVERPLEEFLAQISLLSDQDALRQEESLVTLMTLHNAKGLEYDAVFLIGCEEGLFPHSRSIEEGNLEEERRLCYVGVTRARQRLYATCARQRRIFGAHGYALPSRFLGELPEELVERRSAAPRTGWERGGGLGGTFGSPASRPEPNAELLALRTGDDVVHASFGEGVVTAVEPGGGRRPLRGRRHGAQADGRLRAIEEGGMSATVIDGKAVAARVRERVAAGVREFAELNGGRVPGLATVLASDDPASEIYVGNKREQTEEAGMRSIHHQLDPSAPPEELLELVGRLSADEDVDGILVQLPLPSQHDQDEVIARIDAAKDVDGLTPASAGLLAQGRPGLVPCTPQGVVELIAEAGTDLEGAEAVIVGRSILVGRPLAALLLNANATVTVCHSRTADLPGVCSRADVLVAAVGSPRLIGAEMVKPGATVIDVGTNRTDDGLVGDVDFDAVREVAGAITPVPGGVGPMTIAMLLSNTLLAAQARARS